jgi:ferredoxin--NADP+ reductase
VDDGHGRAAGLEVENTTLVAAGSETKARGTNTFRVIPGDTVVFAIGDCVDAGFGLSTKGTAFVKNPSPRFPVGGLCYEAYDPAAGAPVEGVFFAGWAREASTGLVGAARKDGIQGAEAVLRYLHTLPPAADVPAAAQRLQERVLRLPKPVVTKDAWQRLEAVEQAEAQRLGLPNFKFGSNEEMLEAMGLVGEPR